jgi:hypothetical protein
MTGVYAPSYNFFVFLKIFSFLTYSWAFGPANYRLPVLKGLFMFLKKFLLFSCLGLLTLALSTNLMAQAEDFDNITEEQLAKEGPLTQKDIDVYLNFFEHSAKLMKDSGGKEMAEKDLINITTDFAKNNNITIVRLRYLMEKIPYALMLSSASADEEPPFPYLKISAEEKQLVAQNLQKIMTTIQKLTGQQ